MAIKDPMKKLKDFAKRGFADKIGAAIITEDMLNTAMGAATKVVTPIVRKALIQNYHKMGMGTHAAKTIAKVNSSYRHGDLEKAVSNAIVVLNKRGDGLTYKFPTGLTNELYLIANALQHGWTRGKNRLAHQKQTLNLAMAHTAGWRRSRNTRHRKQRGKRTDGFMYFDISIAQDAEIQKKFTEAFGTALGSLIKERKV